VILLAQEGISNHSIAKQLGLSRPTVVAARQVWRRGARAIAKPKRSRLRRILTPELEKKLLDSILPRL
jgi:transposase